MKKTALLLIIIGFVINCQAAEVLSGFDDENLTVLNEELRKIKEEANASVILTSGVTGILPTANGGTGSSASSNAANGVVILNSSGYLPALNGSLLTNLPAATNFNYSGSTVFNTTLTSGQTFQDLDLSSIVGANRALVILKVVCSGNDVVAIKPGDDNIAWNESTNYSEPFGSTNIDFEGGTNETAYIFTNTDASGVVHIGAETNSTTITIILVAYIK